jgi:hypothetical protein
MSGSSAGDTSAAPASKQGSNLLGPLLGGIVGGVIIVLGIVLFLVLRGPDAGGAADACFWVQRRRAARLWGSAPAGELGVDGDARVYGDASVDTLRISISPLLVVL